MELLPLAALNSITLLGAETVGRAYGGGMLKLEPREADVLPVPSRRCLWRVRPMRWPGTARLSLSALRERRLQDAVRLVDEVLLDGAAGPESRRGGRRALGPQGAAGASRGSRHAGALIGFHRLFGVDAGSV